MDRSAGQWFILHVLSGHEKKVVEKINAALLKSEVAQPVYEVVIPVERVANIKQIKSGVKKPKPIEKKLYPGYVYVRMDLYKKDEGADPSEGSLISRRNLNEAAWYFMKEIQGVIGFIGGNECPIPLSPKEVDDLIRVIDVKDDGSTVARPPVNPGEMVRINDGPFANFEGLVKEVDTERGKLKLEVSIFGRSTPVEADFWQVEREQE